MADIQNFEDFHKNLKNIEAVKDEIGRKHVLVKDSREKRNVWGVGIGMDNNGYLIHVYAKDVNLAKKKISKDYKGYRIKFIKGDQPQAQAF